MSFSRSFARDAGCACAALALLAGCGVKSGDAARAAGEEAFARRDYARAVRDFTESLARSPENADAWFMLARAQLALGDIPAARTAVREAARCASGRTNVVASGETDVIELDGQIAFHAKDYAAARADYAALAASTNAAVRSRGYCGLAVVDMAEIAGSSATTSRESARVHLLDALRHDGGNAAARYHLGHLYRYSYGYKEAALDQFELYARLERNVDDRLKRVQRQTIPDLREEIARAAASRPGAATRDSAASAAALKRAEDAWRKGQYKTARLRYNDAYKADVLSHPAAFGLGKSWEKTDSSRAGLKEALGYYKIAAELRPGSRDTLMKVGDLAMKVSNGVTAAEAYSRAVAARPNDVSAIDGLIRALRKSGDAKSAAVYQKYRDGLPKRTR